MADFYSELQGIAASVLSDFAQGAVEYVAVTPGAGPLDNPGASSEIVHAINAAVRGVSQKYVDNSLILASDLQLTMPGNGVVPDVKGFVRVDGVRYKIAKIMKVPAAGTPVAFIVIFRK